MKTAIKIAPDNLNMEQRTTMYEAFKLAWPEHEWIMLFDSGITPEEREATQVEVKFINQIQNLQAHLQTARERVNEANEIINNLNQEKENGTTI